MVTQTVSRSCVNIEQLLPVAKIIYYLCQPVVPIERNILCLMHVHCSVHIYRHIVGEEPKMKQEKKTANRDWVLQVI